MKRYWTRIALGALVIFGFGLAGIAAVRTGKAKVGHLLASAATRIPLQLAHLGFRLEGQRIGEVSGIDIRQSAPGELGSVTIRVALEGAGAVAGLRDCNLTTDNIGRWNDGDGFRCADAGELDALVQSGTIVFQPGELERPLYLPRHTTERWQRSGIRSLDASLVTDGQGGVTAQGRYDLMDRMDGAERGSFSLKATEDGAVISVRDDRGRSLVDFRADQSGVKLNLRDRHGRNLLKLLADSLGAALRVRH